jgi:hypothetical protein
MKFKICKKCKREFKLNRPDKKFCSTKCRTQFNSDKNYLAVGQTKEYKEEARRRFAGWLKKNRKKHNETMKKYIKKICKTPEYKARQKEYYEKNKEMISKKAKEKRNQND